MSNTVIGYKFLEKGYRSKHGDFIYEIGKTYKHEGEIKLCNSGFHFSEKLEDAIKYVNGDHCVLVEGKGQIIKGKNKVVCSEMFIKEELNMQDVLEKLSNDEYYLIRENVALNPNTPKEILKKLSNDEYFYVRINVARNLNTPKTTLEKLSNDEYYVKANVAGNLSTPKEILEKLSNDENNFVRANVAKNLNTSKEILKKLSNDYNVSVRSNVARNSNTSKKTLEKLSNDEDDYVKQTAQNQLNKLK